MYLSEESFPSITTLIVSPSTMETTVATSRGPSLGMQASARLDGNVTEGVSVMVGVSDGVGVGMRVGVSEGASVTAGEGVEEGEGEMVAVGRADSV